MRTHALAVFARPHAHAVATCSDAPPLRLLPLSCACLERRAKAEWHHRWGPTFGQPSVPEGAEPQWRPTLGPMPQMPPPGRVPQLVEPTMSSLRWDAAVARGSVPMRAPSVASSSRKSGAPSLPGMKPVSISSSADRRRELLEERHVELQAQLALVEEMLKQAKPSTMFSMMSGVSAVSKKSAKSAASGDAAAGRDVRRRRLWHPSLRKRTGGQ